MKRFCYILAGLLFVSLNFVSAQNEVDALRYSQGFPVGTAKSLSLGGAIGAVGGDFTSLSVNPAGIGLYRSSEFTISPSLYWNNTSSDFLGNKYEDESYRLGLGNIGFVINNNKGRKRGWISTSFGFGYNRINNFDQEIFIKGTNNESSYLDNFVYYANNYASLDPLYEQLAYDANLLPFDTVYNEYWNDIENGGYGQDQQRQISRNGSLGEYTFSFGANYNHRLYIGATLGINRLNYEEIITHSETDVEDDIVIFDAFDFEEYLFTSGTGYSLKFGVIGRPASFLRIGAAFHLPTFYYLTDEYENTMNSYFDSGSGFDNQQASSGLYQYNYRLRTPSKFVGSAAVVFGKIGMISLDYEFLNYANANLEASGESFYEENTTIDAVYSSASNIKVGGELKMGPVYFRGGYSFYGSPYATDQPNVDSNRSVYSAGIGLRNRFFFIDAAYSYYSQDSNYYMYTIPVVDPSLNTSNGNTAQLTLGFRF